MKVLVALDQPRGGMLALDLAYADLDVVGVVHPGAVDLIARGDSGATLPRADVMILEARRDTLTAAVIEWCDTRGVSILALCADSADHAMVAAFGLRRPLALGADAHEIVAALRAPADFGTSLAGIASDRAQVIAVWGPHGAPGRTTMAIELAYELSRGGHHVALVDADTHAPDVALALGLPEDAPGLAGACRQAELGGLDIAELTRISRPVGAANGQCDVLTGLNRVSRWPELSASRVAQVLHACRTWVRHTVVDVAASVERDEEIVSDLDGAPRRNAATLAALTHADVVVAVLSADPRGMARFLNEYSEMRMNSGDARIVVVANRLRAGALGIDARGQIRHTLRDYSGIRDVWFVPEDRRIADAALLSSRAIGEHAPRSAMAAAVRRLVGEGVLAPAYATGSTTQASTEPSVAAKATASVSRRARRQAARKERPTKS